jgi:uncharacterized protein (DUF2141 family)
VQLTKVLITAAIIITSFQSRAQTGSIELNISNIRNSSGLILVSVFNQADGFPSDTTKVYRSFVLEARHPSVVLYIDDLPYGEYAVALVHDENKNYQLDTNLVGAPVEGYGASGANKRFSAPVFRNSKFPVREKKVKVEIRMNYLF